jgi:hypothetical protein
LLYFAVIWYIFPVLVFSTKKNLATLSFTVWHFHSQKVRLLPRCQSWHLFFQSTKIGIKLFNSVEQNPSIVMCTGTRLRNFIYTSQRENNFDLSYQWYHLALLNWDRCFDFLNIGEKKWWFWLKFRQQKGS